MLIVTPRKSCSKPLLKLINVNDIPEDNELSHQGRLCRVGVARSR
jgi:hypothetical protein